MLDVPELIECDADDEDFKSFHDAVDTVGEVGGTFHSVCEDGASDPQASQLAQTKGASLEEFLR